MLGFGLIFLLPSVILASNYGNYGSFQNPMIYNDNTQNRDTGIKPGSNLIFNFEQLRRDQPPQIEMRDESLGLYMHKRPQTTTVVPEMKRFPETAFQNNNQFSRFSNSPAPVDSGYDRQPTPVYNQHPTNQIQSSALPSPPPAPKWSDFSETFNKQVFPHYESQGPVETKMPGTPEFNNFQQPQYHSSGPVEKPLAQRMPAAPEFNYFQQPQHQPTVPVQRESPINHISHDFSKSHAFPSITRDMESNQQRQNDPNNRGSHKFNWNDLVTEPSWNQKSQQNPSTSAPVIQGKNPPPLPTLTPWLDGFGK